MRGLAMTSPTFASVKISGRCARKHYGLIVQKVFTKHVHDEHHRLVSLFSRNYSLASNGDQHNSFSYFCPFRGKDAVKVMKWFIKKVRTYIQSTDLGLL